MRSVLVILALAAAVVTAAPQNTKRKERQVVVTNPLNYPSLLYINSAAGHARTTNSNSSSSPIFELILYPADPDPPSPKFAVVVLGGGEATGTIKLTQNAPPTGEVRIEGTISNLTPGLHGFHIHEKGSLELGCVSAGGHYDPFKRDHGSPQNLERHVGDLGNILADETGIAVVNITDPLVTLVGPRSVVGRALVVHAGEDDLGKGGHPTSLTTGNAGGRVGCGVIGIA
ncbi:superoxide dismutase [Cu-Zn]-like isoform X3 [Eriocheir sinensis]|uniref:superoxide dismutase [Cu-Zn]-like isoform X1 n=1 Tax=Eriocheir sinensis TaxID=95602 RepID=UPI0021C9C588|nr:superoxide dismutase [Cu-Zn]-like isoform X1 [Eriocheir sinensis]XP_050691427.1 superoxide dismutase [Cu-Zn]-like isoform X3 [Eriocheir sinensis]